MAWIARSLLLPQPPKMVKSNNNKKCDYNNKNRSCNNNNKSRHIDWAFGPSQKQNRASRKITTSVKHQGKAARLSLFTLWIAYSAAKFLSFHHYPIWQKPSNLLNECILARPLGVRICAIPITLLLFREQRTPACQNG